MTATLLTSVLLLRLPQQALFAAALLSGAAVCAQVQPPTLPHRIPQAPPGLPLTEFYDTPEPLPLGKPGELIRSEPFYDYRLSYEVSALRILYHSRSPSGTDVASSGVILFPAGAPPVGGWPVIAWAHDFTGSARPCAPSLLKNLKDGPLLSMYTGLGYAVVASDYAGLGTRFPHAALDARSNALDVIYSVSAARAALPQLGSKWVVLGYAQGAFVAAAVAEAESDIVDRDYLGAIAISGVADPQEFFERLARGSSYPLLVFLAQGTNTVFPEFQLDEMLTDKAMRLYEYVGHACDARSGPVPPANDMLKPNWQNNSYLKQFFARNAPVQRPASGPILLISGDSDPDVPSSLTAKIMTRLCDQKDRVLFVKYPGIAGSAVLGNSVSEQVSWIRARFSGLPAPGNCP